MLHAWSLLTLAVTVVLLGLGSAVTNLKAGMADPVWPTAPTALLRSTPEQLTDVRWVVEHSHRLAGYVVGCCAIVLVVGLWLTERRQWLRVLGTMALLGIIVQGVLGGLRVVEHVRYGLEFRIAHGSFAQVVVGLLVAVAVFTSRAWSTVSTCEFETRPLVRRAAHVAVALVFTQIVFGVFLRHTYNAVAQRLHLLTAFAATAALVWLAWGLWNSEVRPLRVMAVVLGALLGLQLLLGVEVWMTQLRGPEIPEMLPVTAARVAIRSAHVLGGSLLFAATTAAFLLTRREPVLAAAPPARLETVA